MAHWGCAVVVVCWSSQPFKEVPHFGLIFQFFEASKLVLFARKQTKRSAKIGVFQESGSKKYHQLILGNHKFSGER